MVLVKLDIHTCKHNTRVLLLTLNDNLLQMGQRAEFLKVTKESRDIDIVKTVFWKASIFWIDSSCSGNSTNTDEWNKKSFPRAQEAI